MTYRFEVIIEGDNDDYYARCPALEGGQSQGQTFEEAYANIQEAVALYLETLSIEEIRALANTQVITTTVEVTVAS